MNKLYIILLLAFASSNYTSAQKLGVAINVSNGSDAEDSDVNKALTESLKTKLPKNYVIYDWNNSNLVYLDNEKRPERPCEKAVFITQQITKSNKYKPEVVAKLDTNGVATSATFNIFYNIYYDLKGIDVSTGGIETVLTNYEIKAKTSISDKPVSIDVKKYFGKTKYSNVQKNWSRYSNQMYKDYKESIIKKRNNIKGKKKAELSAVSSAIKKMSGRDIYPIKKHEKEDGKYKTVSVDMTGRTKLVKDDLLEIYTPTTIAGKKTVEYITYLTVNSVEGDIATANKTFIQSSKKLSKKLEAHDNMFGVTNKDVIYSISGDTREKLNLALDTKTKSRKAYEKTILKMPIIRLIERGFENEMAFLRNKYKDERFMDYNIGSIQDKMIGAQYLLTIADNNVNITDIATGQLVAIDKQEGKRNWFFSGYTTAQALNMALMKISDTPIEFLEPTKQKKDKVTKIRLFHPIGFAAREKLDILVVTKEEVGGEIYERKNYIGHGYVSADKHNACIGELKINKKGRKPFYKAMTDNQKIEFMYSIKRD